MRRYTSNGFPVIDRSTLRDRKSTRLNSSHTVIYTLSLHDALPISARGRYGRELLAPTVKASDAPVHVQRLPRYRPVYAQRSEEHTSELQSHSDLHSFPTRRSSDLCSRAVRTGTASPNGQG